MEYVSLPAAERLDEASDGVPTTSTVPLPAYLRSHGRIDASFERVGAASCVMRSYQQGNLRLRIPRRESAGEAPCAVLINTAGGVAEGDTLEYRLEWQPGAEAIATTQAAEKVYRGIGDPARIDTRIAVGAGAAAEWLPQETILFDGFGLKRDARIELADGARFLGVEALVLGRGASGEIVRTGALDDRLRIWRGGRLIYADALVLRGDIVATMRDAGGGARAMAVVVAATNQAATLIGPVRAAIGAARGRAAASAWNGLLAVRLLARDGETLRHDLALALAPLRDGRPLPRVWRC